MDNRKYQNSWFDVLSVGHQIGPSDIARIGLPENVLKMYQQFVFYHFKNALQKMFPRYSDYVDPDWEKLYQEYFKLYPSTEYDLNFLTYQFPEFLVNRGMDWQAELCLYEVLEFQVYIAKTGDSKNNEDVLRLNPTLKVQQFSYHIAYFVKTCDELEAKGENIRNLEIKPGTNILAIARDEKSNLCVFSQLDKYSLAMIEIIKQIPITKSEALSELQQGILQLTGEKLDESEIEKYLLFLTMQQVVALSI